ncbi:MAG: hypothetical protein WDZ77_01280 [Candidatus Pacearchaeota archaeon]
MALDDILIGTSSEAVVELGKIGNWLEALGIIVILWLVFSIATLYFNRKRRKMIEEIQIDLKRIEKKMDSILKLKKK